MPWMVIEHEKLGIVETQYSGLLSSTELGEAVQRTFEVAVAMQRPRLLGDCTQLEGGHSIGDLYFLAEAVSKIPEAVRMREAVVLPRQASMQQAVRFWETLANNRNLEVRLFHDRQAALQWLAEPFGYVDRATVAS